MAGDFEKERFLKEFGRDYGYPNAPQNIDEIRATHFKRLSKWFEFSALFCFLILIFEMILVLDY